MSVRCTKRRKPGGSAFRKVWMIDVDFQHAAGTRIRVRKKSPVQTRRGAEEYERQVRQELLAGTYGKGEVVSRPTLAEFSKEFLSTYAVNNNKPSSIESKRYMLGMHLVPTLGRRRLDEIGHKEIETYKSQKLKEGLSPKSINNQLTTLHKLLDVAVDWGILEHVPRVKWLKGPKAEFDFLTFDETDRLLAAAEPKWFPMIALALKTGLRMGELIALEWGDVDLFAGRLVVRRSNWRGQVGSPKNGRSREVPLSDETVRVLKAHRHLRGELVFCDERGESLAYEAGRDPLRRACRRAGLRKVGWHTLRHSFASHLAMRGVPLKAIQELMGHSTIEMTMRYAHLSPDVKKDAVQLLDRRSYGNLTATEAGFAANTAKRAQKTASPTGFEPVLPA
jgi:integrase